MPSDVRRSERSRTPLRIWLIGLLPVPLLLLIGSAMYPRLPRGQAARPVFTADQARTLATYGSPCLRPEDCEHPLGCLEVGNTGRGVCLNSLCETSSQCEPGEYCRTFQTMGDGLPLRGCDSLQGERAAGEPCDKGLSLAQDRCMQGLLCNRGWCGQPCELQEPSSCPEGFFCQQGLDGPSCVPTCEARSCPEGLQCARESGGISVCAHLRGSHCSNEPCPQGSRCTFTNRRLAHEGLSLHLECVSPCGEGLPACPTGRLCVGSRCLRTCDPQGPDTCYPEERCVYRVDLGVPLCKQVR